MYQEILDIRGLNHSNPTKMVEFDSVHEFVKLKDNNNSNKIWQSVIARFPENSTDWFGVRTLSEFEDVLDKGHPRYVSLVRNNPISVPTPRSIRRRPIRGEYGDDLDIHKVYGGQISTAWRRSAGRLKIGTRNIRIVMNNSHSHDVSESAAKWVGIAALSAAEALESAGYNIAIDTIDGSDGASDEQNICFLVPVKVYEMPLDIQSLTAIVCFTGFFRGPGFMNIGLADGDINGNLGSPFKTDVITKQILPKYYTNNSETVLFVPNSCTSRDEATKWATEAINHLNGTENKKAA